MTRVLGALADRMVGLVAPKAEARAVCQEYWKFCYCQGLKYYARYCGRYGSACQYEECGACQYRHSGC